jgi:hypothetical protein
MFEKHIQQQTRFDNFMFSFVCLNPTPWTKALWPPKPVWQERPLAEDVCCELFPQQLRVDLPTTSRQVLPRSLGWTSFKNTFCDIVASHVGKTKPTWFQTVPKQESIHIIWAPRDAWPRSLEQWRCVTRGNIIDLGHSPTIIGPMDLHFGLRKTDLGQCLESDGSPSRMIDVRQRHWLNNTKRMCAQPRKKT